MKRTLAPFLRCLALLACLAVPLHARAHRLSDSLLRLEPAGDHWSGCLDLPLRDLSLLVELDPNRDGQITWGEVRNALPAITAQLEQHLQFRHGERTLALSQPDLAISRLAGEPCASIAFRIDAPAATALDVRYSLLFDQDPAHRGLLRFQDGERVETRVFGPDAPAHRLESVAPGSPARTDPRGQCLADSSA